jgi:di/tricarboxylate transporter
VSVELISVIILALMFAIATWRDVNMGVLGLVAAFVLGTFFLNLEINDVWKGFPADLFVALVGLTYLFGFAQNNGAIDVLVTWSMRLAGIVSWSGWDCCAAKASGKAADEQRAQRLTAYQIPTLIALAMMVVLVIGFNLNIGVVSMGLAAVLAIFRPSEGVTALGRVSWSVVVLIAGVLTYIALLQEAGTVKWVSTGISAVSIPLVAALLLFYMSGFVSALASSLGIIGVVIALAVPLLQSGDVNPGGFVAALAISATIVDISPFSGHGAMPLANVSPDIRDWFYRSMLAYAGLMCLIGPGLAWFVAAVPTWIG